MQFHLSDINRQLFRIVELFMYSVNMPCTEKRQFCDLIILDG